MQSSAVFGEYDFAIKALVTAHIDPESFWLKGLQIDADWVRL